MQSTRWFSVLAGLGILAQAVPLVFTWNAPTTDGQRIAGFPLPFYSEGGMCGFWNGAAGYCPPSFTLNSFFVDLILVITVAGCITFVLRKLSRP